MEVLLDYYNLDATMKHDWETDLGNRLKKGDKVNISIIEKPPGSNWNLISVRQGGKHMGYVESQAWHTMFDEDIFDALIDIFNNMKIEVEKFGLVD